MKTVIAKDFGTFDAAHQLPNHDGKCASLHGHSYRVEVGVSGRLVEEGPKTGMIIDFADVKQVYKDRIESKMDHALILGTVPLPWYRSWQDLVERDQHLTDEFSTMFLDHHIGKVLHLPIPVTTAEYLAQWMLQEMSDGLRSFPIKVEFVRVWETPTSYAEVHWEEI